jgi:3-oxoacyl-[acyl-carrier-protein] synthase I
MITPVWFASDNIFSPLGFSSTENYNNVRNGSSGVYEASQNLFISKFKNLEIPGHQTRFEFICSKALEGIALESLDRSKTLFILSTTKGNIDLLEERERNLESIPLHATAKKIARHFGFPHYTVISNACISGVMALIIAKRFIENGLYDHAVVLGADVMSDFVVKGFESLMALSNEPCKPFDVNRKGINLGEGAAAIVLTIKPSEFERKPIIKISGGGLSNDANHISGPSRTGEELAFAVSLAMTEAKISNEEIDFISAHGTATLYNDEMEAKAFNLGGLQNVPLHSLKGNFGHTLGAAGIIETVISVHSLLNNEVLPTKGFEHSGVSKPLNINSVLKKGATQTFLKTASGFGGCNGAIVLQKVI